MTDIQKLDQVAKLVSLMNELDCSIWQGVVCVGDSTRDKGFRVVLTPDENGDLRWQGRND